MESDSVAMSKEVMTAGTKFFKTWGHMIKYWVHYPLNVINWSRHTGLGKYSSGKV